jgi:hypothetical protein
LSVTQSSAFCHTCNRQSLYQKPGINHVLHLILTVLTFGFWAFVWIVLGIINSSKRPLCVTCGTHMGFGGSLHSPVPQQYMQPLDSIGAVPYQQPQAPPAQQYPPPPPPSAQYPPPAQQ